MQTDTYIVSTQPFPEWLNTHQSAQHIAITGNLTSDRLFEFDTVKKLQGKTIDISNLAILFTDRILQSAFSQDPADILLEYYFQTDEQYYGQLPLLFILYANQHLGHIFIVTDRYIFTEDRKSIVYFICDQSEISLSEGIINIGNYACRNNELLQKLQCPQSLQTIGNYAFENCRNLKVIHFPEKMKSLGEDVFSGCFLHDVKLPDGITKLPAGCFNDSSFFNLHIPGTVKIIEERSLGFVELEEITIPEGVEEIGHQTFQGIHKIHFPSTLKKLDEYFFCEYQVDDYKRVPYITVHPDNPCFYSKDGTIYRKGETTPYTPYPFTQWFEPDTDE